MIHCICTVEGCWTVANYRNQTLQQIQDNPPFSNIPKLEGEHTHQWEIKYVQG